MAERVPIYHFVTLKMSPFLFNPVVWLSLRVTKSVYMTVKQMRCPWRGGGVMEALSFQRASVDHEHYKHCFHSSKVSLSILFKLAWFGGGVLLGVTGLEDTTVFLPRSPHAQ